MRVIKSGREKEWFVTCPECGSDLVYKSEDIRMLEKRGRELFRKAFGAASCQHFEPPMQTVTAVRCPECDEAVEVPERAKGRRAFAVDGGEWD